MKKALEKFYSNFIRDTQFSELMNKRIYNVLLIATKYDIFSLEEDGRIDEQIFNEYMNLSLRYPPRFTRVQNKKEAIKILSERVFELIIIMPNLDKHDIFSEAKEIKERYQGLPIIVLTPFSKEISKRVACEDLSFIDYIFSWLGDSELLIAIIKLIEDKWNALPDSNAVGVQVILLIEDSVRTYSSILCQLYKFVLAQSKEFAKEALNEHLKTLRMRGRPKILLARNYEEALDYFYTYQEHILGIISDLSFKKEGKNNPLAGAYFCKKVKDIMPKIPIILQSTNTERGNILAKSLNVKFLSKNENNYLLNLQHAVSQLFGFGCFNIIDPDKNTTIMQIHDLREMQHKIFLIPDKSLYYHLKRNHFSRFFYSRALFPLAKVIKEMDITNDQKLDEIRNQIYNLIIAYRKMKNTGVIADFEESRFDECSNFTKIGKGSLGGKGRGIAFMTTWNIPDYGPNLQIQIPQTVVLCTDVFDEFMEKNGLYSFALSTNSNQKILETFMHAELPKHVQKCLLSLCKASKSPLAIRSSSMLEDSHYQPFAGIYSTYMIPYTEDAQLRSLQLEAAIKGVFASVFYKESKLYLLSTKNLIDQEKMAVVLQEVVGNQYGDFYFPMMSGVAHSTNYYPIDGEQATDGVMHIALGLGKYVVDGGATLRIIPKYTQKIMQLSTIKSALKSTQSYFYALRTKNKTPFQIQTDDTFNLCQLPIDAAHIPSSLLPHVVSTYDPENQSLYDGYYPEYHRLVISFKNLLNNSNIPFAKAIEDFLSIGKQEFGRPIEIEFALTPNQKSQNMILTILQARPIVENEMSLRADLDKIDLSNTILKSNKALGNGCYENIKQIILIKKDNYSPCHNKLIVKELESLTSSKHIDQNGYILIGPGRWGSTDSWLGIPIQWSTIKDARIIVECCLKNVEPSQGSHFFHNITSLGIGYISIIPTNSNDYLDLAFLKEQDIIQETEHVALIGLKKACIAYIDGKKSQAVILKPSKPM